MGPLESSDAAAARFGAESTSGLSGAPLPSEERGIGERGPSATARGARAVAPSAARRPAARRAGRGSRLRRARSRHQQLPAAGRAAAIRQLGETFASSMPFPASSGLARACARRGRLSEAAIRRTDRSAGDLPRQDDGARRHARPPDRHRSLPRRREWRRIPRDESRESTGLTLEIIDSGDRGAACGRRAAPRLPIRGRERRPVRYRRRLVRNRLARPAPASARRRAADAALRELVASLLKLGVVTLAERFGGADVVARDLRGHGRPGRLRLRAISSHRPRRGAVRPLSICSALRAR